jgi:integrase/recombinase XerD
MNTIDHILEGFESYNITKGIKSKTIQNQRALVTEFLQFYFVKTNKSIAEANEVDLRRYFLHIHQRKKLRGAGVMKGTSPDHHLTALRGFFDWLYKIGSIYFHPLPVNFLVSLPSEPVYGLSRAEVKLLFDAANSITERIILHLHYSLGLRRAESFKLTIDEVLLEKKIIIVKNGKYGKRREIPLLDSIITDFIRYSVYRTEIISSTGLSHKFFLVTTKGEPSDYAFAYGLVKSMAKRAGVLEGHVTLHQLRHSIATHLKEAGVPLEFVKQLLGHLNEATTMGYMNASTHQLKKRLRYGTSK